MKEIIKIISSVLHSWDADGYTPTDEYDDMALKLYKHLMEGKSKEQLANFTEEYLTETMGLAVSINLRCQNISPKYSTSLKNLYNAYICFDCSTV